MLYFTISMTSRSRSVSDPFDLKTCTCLKCNSMKCKQFQLSFDDCKCLRCAIVKNNVHNNHWIHAGQGKYYKSTDDLFDKLLLGVHKDIFNELPVQQHGTEYKPKNVIWFSCGSWLFDPHCNRIHDPCVKLTPTKYRVITIDNPKNILSIDSYAQLLQFIKMYKNPNIEGIDWNLVASNYSGVAFKFRKVFHLRDAPEGAYDQLKILWHSGYDVESLCIFSTKSFDNIVNIEEIYL